MKRLWVLAVAAAAAACTGPKTADREVRLARLAAQRAALLDSLEDLQARLIVDRERVRFWQEMQQRHESISAIACTSLEAPAVAMVERLLPPGRPGPELGSRVRARVASVHPGPGSPPRPRR